ncbi:MAG: hemerythrin family protein [Planctomycetes bacterium]|nr:hemerythrin family protein [Planctomycetota bacterium]
MNESTNFINWCILFECDSGIIDEEHKQLFKIANEFYNNIKEKKGDNAIYQTLNELTKYAQDHFSHEENILKDTDFPTSELENHKQIHANLILEIFSIHNTQMSNQLGEVKRFLTNWLIMHILIEDRKYLKYLNTP